MRKTKIICTLGPATEKTEILRQLIQKGTDVFRLNMSHASHDWVRDIVPRIVRAAPHAVILVVTDPPDPLADIARVSAGHDRVLSTGTFLDSLRFRVHLAAHFDVDANQAEAQVLGEHGVSQVFLWSSARR